MVYSENLMRNIYVPVELLNNFEQAELDAAFANIPRYYDLSPVEFKRLAAEGSIDAALICRRAAEGNEHAVQFVY